MPLLTVEAVAPVGSWRAPDAMTFHRTYPLPPYTAVVGMLGAAMGLDLPAAYSFVSKNSVKVGVGGWTSGAMRDLWKFQKLGDKDDVKSAVLLREHRVDVRLVLLFQADDSSILTQVKAGFDCPEFPLTAGQSDALLRVVCARMADAEIQSATTVHSVLLFEELTPDYQTATELASVPLTHTIQAPQVERIPTGFSFDENKQRSLSGRALVTFVADPVTVPAEHAISGYHVEPQSSFLSVMPFGRESFPWIIPVHQF